MNKRSDIFGLNVNKYSSLCQNGNITVGFSCNHKDCDNVVYMNIWLHYLRFDEDADFHFNVQSDKVVLCDFFNSHDSIHIIGVSLLNLRRWVICDGRVIQVDIFECISGEKIEYVNVEKEIGLYMITIENSKHIIIWDTNSLTR
jgi:hypothetical protein